MSTGMDECIGCGSRFDAPEGRKVPACDTCCGVKPKRTRKPKPVVTDTGWKWAQVGRCIHEAYRTVVFPLGTPESTIETMRRGLLADMSGQSQHVKRDGLTLIAYQCADSSD